MVVIVNYGLGNLGSILNMLKYIGVNDAIISDSPEDIINADKLILPGVGAFDAGMQKINTSGLLPTLNEAVLVKKIPVLGICLGMQLMTQSSEEGQLKGLGWIDAEVKKFQLNQSDFKIPHMGWNYISTTDPALSIALPEPSKFYFVHSYYIKCHHPEDIIITCHYGNQFTAGFCKDNIMGVQFHPEKSHKYGMALLKYFIEKFNTPGH